MTSSDGAINQQTSEIDNIFNASVLILLADFWQIII